MTDAAPARAARVFSRLRRALQTLRPSFDGPSSWLWFVGIARIGLIFVVASGANLASPSVGYSVILAAIYLAALCSSLWYLWVLRRVRSISAALTWMQMLVDFSVVAATISGTGQESSFFTFLFVVVILEAGVLMGLSQGFVFATLATFFMFFQSLVAAAAAPDLIAHWYNFLIQGIAFFFTAFISGYWNQRVSRMKQFQREILDNMNSGFLITDRKGVVIAVNKAGCEILHLLPGNVAGRHVDGILVPESGAECPITTALRLDKDFSSYELYVQTDGRAKLLGLTTNRIRDLHGRVTGIIASFTDLTEMARMRQELQKQDRLAVIGELSAGLAHEIRNPVASIRSAIEELGRSAGNPSLAARLTAIALRESDHLNEIVGSFLDFARDPGRRHETLLLSKILIDVAEHLRRKYDGEADFHLDLRLSQKEFPVMGDPTQLRQVFLNLGQNAVEAMNGRGTLTVVLQCESGPAEVRFEDEGPGIAPDKTARIFEPFYTEKERGVGMGLAICMRIITAHDGTIQAASRHGGGASLIVRLPAG